MTKLLTGATVPSPCLCMLLFFEGTHDVQAETGLSLSLTMLRNMRRPAMNIIYARRAGAWNQVSSDEIVPGDLILPEHSSQRRRDIAITTTPAAGRSSVMSA